MCPACIITAARQTEFTTHMSLGPGMLGMGFTCSLLTLYNNSEHLEYFVPSVPLYLREQRRQASTSGLSQSKHY